MSKKHDYHTIKIWRETLQLLYQIKSDTLENISEIVHRAVEAEIRKHKQEEKSNK